MTERELFEAIGHVDDDLILAADAPVKKRRRAVHLHWQQVVSVAACACIVLGGAAVWRSGTLRKSSIAGEVAMAADVPEAAAETAPAPDMPMSDAAAPQAADADEGAAVEKDSAASGIALGHGDEHVRPAFINTPHSAIESMWFQYAMKDVPHAVASVTGDTPDVRWISMNTDPWNMVIPSSGQER